MTEPTRVLLVSHESEFGGAERSLVGLLEAVDRARFAPRLACSGPGPLTDAVAALDIPVDIVPMAFRGKLQKALGLLRASRALAGLVRRHRIDVLHANTLIAGYCAVRAGRLARTPVVWHVRDATYPAAARWAVRRADRVVANSCATAASLGDVANVQVIYNGVPDAFFQQPIENRRRALRDELGIDDRTVVLATVGRIDPQKGHDVLIDAIRELAEPGRVCVLVVGDVMFDGGRARFGTLRAELEQRAHALPVRFLGSREDVPALLAGCDALVHPTKLSEAFGRSIAEAQALGLPVVASDLGGIPELIEDGATGLLVTPGDARALARAIDRLVVDTQLRARLGDAARTRAHERFTARRHAERIEALWLELGSR